MDKENTPVSAFYDSDEDFSWGPVTLREIKRNLRRTKKLDPKTYRRQTAAFIPLPAEDNTQMYTANSTQSSKEYFTANESMDSNLKATSKETPQNNSNINSPNNTDKNSEEVSINMDPVETYEVVSISSDSEDDIELPGPISVKKERITGNQLTEPNYSMRNEESLDEEVISLSSDDEKSDLEYVSTNSNQGVGPRRTSESGVEEEKPSINEMEDEFETSKGSISHVHESFSKQRNESLKNRVLNYFSSNYPVDQDFSLEHKTDSMPEKSINISEASSSENSTEELQELDKSETGEVSTDELQTNFNATKESIAHSHESFSERQGDSVKDRASNYFSSNYPVDQDFCSESKGGYSTSEKTSNVSSDVSSNKNVLEVYHLNEELNRSRTNGGLSIKELQTEINASKERIVHTHKSFSERKDLSNYFSSNYPVDQDFSLGSEETDQEVPSTENRFENLLQYRHDQKLDEISDDSNRQNDSSIEHGVNVSQKENEYSYSVEKNETFSKQVSDYYSQHSESSNISKSHENNKFPVSPRSNSKVFSQDVDSIDNTCEDLENVSLNDTFSEMQKLLAEDSYPESDDSSDDIIESTPYKKSEHPKDFASANCSRIPVPTHSSEGSINTSSVDGGFKVPKFPPKSARKTPGASKLIVPKHTVSPLKDIVSPVRLYIKNSPFSALKQTHKPACSRSQLVFSEKSVNCTVSRRLHKDIRESLPEIVYKPSAIVKETVDRKIILPKNIKSLIIDRSVIKHESRKRINLNDSVFTVGDKLDMQDLSHIVSDEHNMSVHTIKHGLNM